MKKRTPIPYPISFIFLLVFLLTGQTAAGTSQDDALFNSALRHYVGKLTIRFGQGSIDRERFLVQQIRMINDEIKSRVKNIPQIRDAYFKRLQKQLEEIRDLKKRLAASGSTSLNRFINDLEKKIQETIDGGIINHKRQKVITDAVQLLHVGEEMIRSDPHARLEENPEFSDTFKQTRNEFFRSFGLTPASKVRTPAEVPANPPTVFDVYTEWKSNEWLKYELRWTDVQIMKRRLLKKGTVSDVERMFKRELRQAAEAYNFGFYDLAARSFAEILKRYTNVGKLDDCLYLEGESDYYLGRFNEAQDIYKKFIEEYPTSAYLPKAYKRLLQIAYHFEKYDRVIDLYHRLRSLISTRQPGMQQMAFLAVVAAQKGGRFDDVTELVFDIPKNSALYRESRFVLAEAYAGNGNLKQAAKVFNELIAKKNVEPNFRFLVLLKLGYINYDQGKYFDAIRKFDQIAGTYPQYDRALIGYAWATYKNELSRPKGQEKDFSATRKYLETLLDNFYASDYILEAKTLLGYIDQLDERVDEALDYFGYAFHAKEVKKLSDNLNGERDQLSTVMKTADRLQDKALEKENPQAFYKAYAVSKKIRQPLLRLNYMDLSASGVALKSEVDRLQKQSTELERLKKIARQRQNSKLVKRIEKLQLKIFRVVNSLPAVQNSALGFNYFDAHPLARKVSVVENNNKKLKALRESTHRQREEVKQKLADLDLQIQQAESAKNYKKLIQLELSKDRFISLAKKLDYLETSTYAMGLEATDINLNHWADYGAFGMTNVRFAIKNKKDKQIAEIQDQINQINTFLEQRKATIEHKIAEINDQITLMTRRVRKQERIREREELKKEFNESYFDTHDTEMNYNEDTTQPPKIKDENH